MTAETPTIVLVQGAWADATGFDAEIRALRERALAAMNDPTGKTGRIYACSSDANFSDARSNWRRQLVERSVGWILPRTMTLGTRSKPGTCYLLANSRLLLTLRPPISLAGGASSIRVPTLGLRP